MPPSTNFRAFPHVQSVLDEAVLRKGLRYTLPSAREAITFRTHAYHFRKLYQKEQYRLAGGITVPTVYDGIFITLDGATVVIQLRDAQVVGRMTTLDGLPITPETKAREPEPTYEHDPEMGDLIEVAERVKKGDFRE